MRTKWFVLMIAAFAVLTLSGCGSNGGSGGSDVADSGTPGTVETVGIVNCTKCHSAATKESDFWLTSNHGNPDNSPGSSGPYDETSDCQPCHNQLLDGQTMPEAFPEGIVIGERTDRNTGAIIPIYADTPRNVASCESCHGGGSAHRGVGPIPFPRPDWEQCVSCHDIADDGVRDRHIENWGMLATSVGESAHNNADDLHASTTRCQRCHTAEGSVQLSEYTGDSDVMHLMDDLEPIAAEEDLHPVTCSTCHVPHKDSGRWDNFIVNDNDLVVGDWDPNANGVADQFDFCTSCHTYYNQDGVMAGSGSDASGTAPFYHNTAWYRLITTTHYDDPSTGYGLDESRVEGYVIRQTIDGEINESPCFDCHGHELRTNTRRSRDEPEADDNAADYGSTIHTQWASSGHAGGLLNAKYDAADGTSSRTTEQVDAVMMAGASDDTSGGGFTHYDWDAPNRQSCQMCHTATGAMNFLDDQEGYDSANNDYSHLEGWSTEVGSTQNELLYCWGCHENAATGVLRDPGPVTLAYTNLAGENPTIPDQGSSNVCINCHSGRGGMDRLLNGANPDPAGAPVTGGTRTHYYASGGTIFQALTNIGYMYVGAGTYEDKSYYAHNSFGCAECHMNTEESHTYKVVEKDEDTITAINSNVCVSCHDGEHALFVAAAQVGTTQNIWDGSASVPTTVTQVMADDAAAEMEHESHGYHNSLGALGVVLTEAGTPPSPNYPYFTGDSTDQGHGGAMHNYSYLHHEPGGYAHNRYYAKRLIFDSIDWLSNPTDGGVDAAGSRTLDGAIFLDPATYDAAIIWLGGDPATGIVNVRP